MKQIKTIINCYIHESDTRIVRVYAATKEEANKILRKRYYINGVAQCGSDYPECKRGVVEVEYDSTY